MKLFDKLSRVDERIWFVFILTAAAALYMYKITFSDVWIDEAFTLALVRHPFGDIADLLRNDFHPPLYFYALKVFVTIFGASSLTVRLFSTIGLFSLTILGYVVGRRLFGKSGALYFCILVLSMPLLTASSHEARMYAWSAFLTTGMFLYAALFLSTGKRSDLILLMLFSLMAAYTHYYGLLAAGSTNAFVFLYLTIKRNRIWRLHLGYSLMTLLLYFPWIFEMLDQVRTVQKGFWVPPLTWQTVVSCILTPFASRYWLPPSWPLAVVVYGITIWIIYKNYVVRKDQYGTPLGLALFIFGFTIFIAVAVSLALRPILYTRYVVVVAVMLLVPMTLFFISVRNVWVKGIVIVIILYLGISTSMSTSNFSFGPYKQSVDYLHEKYPDIKKVFHVFELTAGPFVEYSNYGIENYWFKTDSTVVFTNMDAFNALHTVDSPSKALKPGEPFCLVSTIFLPFNEGNLKRVISESQLVRVDTVWDSKVEFGSPILLYVLNYRGIKSEMIHGS